MTPDQIQEAEEWIAKGKLGLIPMNPCLVGSRILPLFRKYIEYLKDTNHVFLLKILETEHAEREEIKRLRNRLARALRKVRALDSALTRSTECLERLIEDRDRRAQDAADAKADWESWKERQRLESK